MEVLSLEALEGDALADAYDAAVAASADLDRFCSSSDWILPAARGLMPERAAWIRREGDAFVALAHAEHTALGQRWLEPLEAMWGLACPAVGRDLGAVAALLARALSEGGVEVRGATIVLCGLAPGSPRLRALAGALAPRYQLGLASPTRRHVAELSGGVEAWLARRSRAFRRALRKAHTRAARLGVQFVPVHVSPEDADAAWLRIAAVDDSTWKGEAGIGVGAGPMAAFYRLMLRRLAARGAARLVFARLGERDAGYILGGVRGDTYRGLQFGFVSDAAPLSLGNLLQAHQIEMLCGEGVLHYDLGAEVAYKVRWGDRVDETVTLVALPR